MNLEENLGKHKKENKIEPVCTTWIDIMRAPTGLSCTRSFSATVEVARICSRNVLATRHPWNNPYIQNV
jgi:hypothetical protein